MRVLMKRNKGSNFLWITLLLCLLFDTLGAVPRFRIYSLIMAEPRFGNNSPLNNLPLHQKLKVKRYEQDSSGSSVGSPLINRSHASKRSTMLLNKLMHALHKALDSEGKPGKTEVDQVAAMAVARQMDLQRRAGEGKMFWRCYFNAVSCF